MVLASPSERRRLWQLLPSESAVAADDVVAAAPLESVLAAFVAAFEEPGARAKVAWALALLLQVRSGDKYMGGWVFVFIYVYAVERAGRRHSRSHPGSGRPVHRRARRIRRH